MTNWAPVRVEITDRARRDIRGLDGRVRERVLRCIDFYARTGEGNVKRLQGGEDFRLRVGDYRIRFSIVSGELRVMLVLRVAHRREVYR